LAERLRAQWPMNDSEDLILLDSNILIYAEQEKSPYFNASKVLRDSALTGEVSACISPQVLCEFFAVTTDSRRATDPLTVQEAIDQIKKYSESEDLTLIYPGSGIIGHLLSLLQIRPATGSDIYDLFLTATMLENNVHRIYTFNTKDFAPFSEIEVLTPPDPMPDPISAQPES